MKTIVTLTTLAVLALTGPSYAFGNGGSSKASSSSQAHSSASANNVSVQNNEQRQTQRNTQTQGNSQNVEIRDRRQAPAVSAPSMSSGHPCAYGGSFGISIVGGGVSGGGNKIDHACMLYQSGQIDAANYLLASQNNDVCRALRAVGSISSESLCGDSPTSTYTDEKSYR